MDDDSTPVACPYHPVISRTAQRVLRERARETALERLATLHWRDFDRIYAEERAARGLPVEATP